MSMVRPSDGQAPEPDTQPDTQSDAEPPSGEAPPTPPTAGRRRRSGTVAALGNAIVGFDYAVLRSTRPPAILVEAAKPVRGLSGEGGRMLSIEFPGDAPGDPTGEPPDGTPPDLRVG